ncbi:MAG: acyl dehydratase [Polaribacter sp.]|jgi:acyl dehydratase|tara:strand:- start:1311 stop:1769 length:459 start_codon:yes stop_codon:yes gene_type:complete
MQSIPKNEMIKAVGMKLGPSEWLEVSQQRINEFANCTDDHQFIHVDEEKAKETPFGGTIAHGFLTLSLLAKFSEEIAITPENTVMGMNYGFDKIRFLAPVRSGKRVRMVGEVLNVDRKDENRFLTKISATIEIEGEDTPALVGEFLLMSFTE